MAPTTRQVVLPSFSRFRDLQSSDDFFDRVESFCLAHSVSASTRLQIALATLGASAKLRFHFAGDFDTWEQLMEAFWKEFSAIDHMEHLKAEQKRTKYSQENSCT